MPAILFVCTANQFRSVLSAACLRGTLSPAELGNWQISSAGTWTTDGEPAPMATRHIARKLGLQDVDQHRTRMVNRDILEKNDLVLVMEANHKEALCAEFPKYFGRIFMLSEVLSGHSYDFPDPFRTGDDLNESAAELYNKITAGYEKILRLAETLQAKP